MRNKANQQIKVILVHLEKRLSLFYNGLLNLHQLCCVNLVEIIGVLSFD